MESEYATLGNASLAKGAMNFDAAQTQAVQDTGPPLTQITLAHIGSTNNQLNDIVNRLSDVRDRLFGSAPTNLSRGDAGASAPISSFSEAFARSAQETHMLLAQLDKLSYELASRL